MSVNDSRLTKQVVLLGRPGPARDRLREAITLAGGRIVLEDEPVRVSAVQLLAANPDSIVVALDPVIEEAFEPLETVLNQAGVMMLFDDAEVAARREGWDAQRWVRHLSAKLHGHTNVLPSRGQSEPLPVSTALGIGQSESTPASLSSLNQLDRSGSLLSINSKIPLSRTVGPPAAARPLADHRVNESIPLSSQSAATSQSTVGSLDQHRPKPSESAGATEVTSIASDNSGVVVVLAGVGGMDALRHFFSALPNFFQYPIIIAMALDTVQCANLVRQMQRISQLPVSLAKIGEVARAQHVFVLPSDIGLGVQLSQLFFDRYHSLATWLQSIPIHQSAILMLSGASTTAVATVLSLHAKGVWVAGQSPAGCYDSTAATELISHGCPSGDPAQLATMLTSLLPTIQPQVRRQ